MNEWLDSDLLDRALGMLGELLEYRRASPCELVVCGDAALIAAGLVERTTRDVDILAFYDGVDTVSQAEPLPPVLVAAAEEVATEFGLDKTWLNNGPRGLVNSRMPNQGLPEGLPRRLTGRRYGTRLSVYFVGRLDQVHFKVLAAADYGGSSRHQQDLEALCPTDDELVAAVRWACEQDPTEEFAATVRGMLKATGREHLCGQL